MSSAPRCIVFCGPNGAGKTTFALQYLPGVARMRAFANADSIAAGLSPLDPALAQVAAARLFLDRLHASVRQRHDVAFETTCSGRSHVHLLRQMKRSGYVVTVVFLWIPSAAFSEARVRQRALQGGHDVPRDMIRRRFPRCLANFRKLYAPLADHVMCYDNSAMNPSLVFERHGSDTVVYEPRHPAIRRDSLA